MALGPRPPSLLDTWWPLARWILLAAAVVGILIGARCYGDRRAAAAAGMARAAAYASAAADYERQKAALEAATARRVMAAEALAAAALDGQRRMEVEVARIRATRPDVRVRGTTITVRAPSGDLVSAEVPSAIADALAARLAADSAALGTALAAAAGLAMATDSLGVALAAQKELTRLADSALVNRRLEGQQLRAVKSPRYGMKDFLADAGKVVAGALVGAVAALVLSH